MKQNNCFVCYSPILDLSTCGKTYEEAQNNFEEALDVFFEEAIEAVTLGDLLLELGWTKFKTTINPLPVPCLQ